MEHFQENKKEKSFGKEKMLTAKEKQNALRSLKQECFFEYDIRRDVLRLSRETEILGVNGTKISDFKSRLRRIGRICEDDMDACISYLNGERGEKIEFRYVKKDGTYDSYSTRVYKTKKESTETIALDSNNTNGNISSKVVSDNVIYPAGSKSKETWKCADTSIDFGVESGLIDVGAKSITLNMKVSQTLTNISIVVYSKTGEPLSWNDNSAHPFTCYLYGIPDSKLRGAYIQVIANCSTKNITENYAWYNGVEPATAVASLQANSITINY